MPPTHGGGGTLLRDGGGAPFSMKEASFLCKLLISKFYTDFFNKLRLSALAQRAS